jgi:hypothetical protein
LVQGGFRPWLDEEELLPGQDWEAEIAKAVHDCDVVIVCLSSKSTAKTGYVQKEIRFALDVADRHAESNIFLIPVKLEECEVPGRLSRWQWVNLCEERSFDRLVKALQKRAHELGVLPQEPTSDSVSAKEEMGRVQPLALRLKTVDGVTTRRDYLSKPNEERRRLSKGNQRRIAYTIGSALIVAIVALPIFFLRSTSLRNSVLRIVMAAAVAAAAGTIPRFLGLRVGRAVCATSTIAIFVIAYLFSPAQFISTRDTAEPNLPSSTTAGVGPVGIALGGYEFDTIQVDSRGKVVDRRKGRGRYFVEDLGGGLTLEMVEIPGGGF